MDKRKGNKSKRYAIVKDAIDRFWIENHYPPTIRDLMEMTGVTSTSVMTYYIKRLPEIRVAKYGRIIPVWVDAVFAPQQQARNA
jgi:hypothetical protein